MVSVTGHAILEIVKGVQKVPGDDLSAEVGLDQIDLLDPQGFSTSEYDIKLPGLKSSALYADSPLTDGRTLISGALGNVTETIRCELTAGTIVQLAAMLSKLLRFKQDCNDFWDTFGQIEPVYIKHQVVGEPGPRFALLYDIDVDIDDPIEPGAANRAVTIVIEREYGWRGIAPGDNPKHWFYIWNNQEQQWSASNAHLLTGTDHLVSGTIQNRAELNAAISGFITQNFIEIPANKIPGDMPALVSLSVQQTVSVNATTLLCGKMTKRPTGNISRFSGNNQIPIYNFNAADGNVIGGDTTLASDTGTPIGTSGSRQRSVTTFATIATMSNRLTFFPGTHTPNGFSLNVMRGRYAVFLRARLSAASTNVSIQMTLRQGGNDNLTTTPVILTDQGAGGTGNSTDWALMNLGQIVIPVSDKTSVGADGRGVFVDNSGGGQLSIALAAARNSGAGSLYMSDLILIPIDEGAIQIEVAAAVGTGATVALNWAYDNTGYFTHGTPDEFAALQQNVVANARGNNIDIAVLSGSPIYLTPGILNRLYFLAYVNSTKRSIYNDPSAMFVRVNIVPRWMGLRDS